MPRISPSDDAAVTSGPPRREILISNNKLDRDITALAGRLAERAWRAVIGVANGGIYPAGRVADHLRLDYREIEIKAYRGRSKGELEIIRALDDPERGRGLIVVDDIVDSGDTALAIRQMLPGALVLSIYAKADGLAKLAASGETHLCAERFPQDVWIVFPWHQPGWAGEMPQSVARYRAAQGLAGRIPITRQ